MVTGEACDCSGLSCTDAEFCYDGSCNTNAKGNKYQNRNSIFCFLSESNIFIFVVVVVVVFELVLSVVLQQLAKLVIVLKIYVQMSNFVMMEFVMKVRKVIYLSSIFTFCFEWYLMKNTAGCIYCEVVWYHKVF